MTNEKNIDYSNQSINSAFKDHYTVPDYQREYVWENEQVEKLLSDLLDAYDDDSNKPYFLGTIVTYNADGRFELIDGQQRLTTFFILLCAIKEKYVEFGEDASVIKNLIYSAAMNKNGDVENLYHLQLQYEDAGDCLQRIEQGLDKPATISHSGLRMFAAHEIIKTFLNDKFPEKKEFKKFVPFLLYNTSFVRIETYNITDALKIFETINQRGKGLDSMDLLKNMIFRQVDRSEFPNLNKKWREITSALEEIDEKPLRFLRYFIMANYDTSAEKDGILREDRIYGWLTENNDQCHYEEHPLDFVTKMKKNIDIYTNCINPQNTDNGNEHLKNIPKLAGSSYRIHLMIMLAASENMQTDALAYLKRIVESVVYYVVINRIPAKSIEKIFAQWCTPIREVKTMPQLKEFIHTIVKPAVDNLKVNNESNFMRLGLNSMQQYRVKFILAKISAYVDAMRLNSTAIGDLEAYTKGNIEIEHIMPQTCTDCGQYGMTEEDFGMYVNRFGNLTLLENSINKSIQNRPYVEKVLEYKKSRFYLTSSVSDLVDVGQNTAINRTNVQLQSWKVWDKQAIDERQKMLYELSEEIWKIE